MVKLGKLTVRLIDGTTKIYEENEWADYSWKGDVFVVSNEEKAWIGIYPTRSIFSVECNQQKVEM